MAPTLNLDWSREDAREKGKTGGSHSNPGRSKAPAWSLASTPALTGRRLEKLLFSAEAHAKPNHC